MDIRLISQSEEVMEFWCDKSLNQLLASGALPMTDAVWATDNYFERIFANAEDLYSDYLYERGDQ